MPWLWADQIGDSEAQLQASEVDHLKKALRGRVGGEVRVLDGAGQRAVGTWLGEDRLQIAQRETLPPPRVTLVFGLGSRESNEESIRRAAELGAARIVPALCRRSRDAGAPKVAPMDRWLKIVRSACGQSGNAWLPALQEPKPFEAVRAELDQALYVVDKSGKSLLLQDKLTYPAVAVGPEGGWEPGEIAGLPTFGLGPYVLRTHVAVAVVMGQYALDF